MIKRCFAHDDSHRDSTSCGEQEEEEGAVVVVGAFTFAQTGFSTSIPSIVPFAGAVEEPLLEPR